MSIPCPECGGRTYVTGMDKQRFDDEGEPYVKRWRMCSECKMRLISEERFIETKEPDYMEGAFR